MDYRELTIEEFKKLDIWNVPHRGVALRGNSNNPASTNKADTTTDDIHKKAR